MKKYLFLCLVFATVFLPKISSAAVFSISLDRNTFSVGDQFTANIKIDSQDASVNAAQATINFSSDVIQVVSLDKGSSVFNFWLQDPAYDNGTGQISFIGGSTAGFTGASLSALKVVFKVKGAGPASLNFSDGAITASDGSGTNLLTKMTGVQFSTAGAAAGVTPPVSGGGTGGTTSTATTTVNPPTSVGLIPAPVQINRPAAPAKGLPGKPVVSVTLYPDQKLWYNTSENYLVSWDLPADVSAVSTAVNKSPSYEPRTSEGLFDNKYFMPLSDGIWYLHVQFRNGVGWGPVNHYKISVDTFPPLPFEIKMDQSTSTDTPDPTIRFTVVDQPSGIDFYRVRVDGTESVVINDSFYKLPVQAPGDHVVSVRARDKAGNLAESSLKYTIMPLGAPTISGVSSNTYLGDGTFQTNGTAPIGDKMILNIKNTNGELVSKTIVDPDANGNWNLGVDMPNKTGSYFVEAITLDSRGATSFPVKSDIFDVRVRPLFVWGVIEVTSTMLILFLLLLMGLGFAAGYFVQKLAKEQRARKVIIAERDISVVFNLIRADVDKMLSDYSDGQITPTEAKETEFYLRHIIENLDKMKRYMTENVESIGE